MPIYRMTDTQKPYKYERIYRPSQTTIYGFNGPCYVYALLDEEDETDEIRYIGVTGNPFARYLQHGKGQGKGPNDARAAWAREAYSRNALRMILLWVKSSRAEALGVERDIIKEIAGPMLFNDTHNKPMYRKPVMPDTFTTRFERYALLYWIQIMANESHPHYRQFLADIVRDLATGKFRGKHFGPVSRDDWNECARFYLIEHCGLSFEAIDTRHKKEWSAGKQPA